MSKIASSEWKPTACILCSINCGLEVQTEASRITKVRGDEQAQNSQGYLCQKASQLGHYQSHAARLTQPLRRRDDGSFEPVSWDDAIADIAKRLKHIRDSFGGETIAYYGGGGQGNHLGGAYASALHKALRTPYIYTALAQEKTGDFWVNGKLFGKQSCFAVEGMEEAEYAIVLGANPWIAHGFARTRTVLQDFQKNTGRTLVVIDPRVSETAKMADIHLAVRPGMDAFLLSAMIAIILRDGLENKAFISQHSNGFAELKATFSQIDIDDYAARSGVPLAQIEHVAHGFAKAKTATVRADLGIQQSLHSTLNSYLEKLLFLVTGNFNRKGGNHLAPLFVPLIGHSEEGKVLTQVTKMQGISKLFPPNILPLEILSDHPKHTRAVIVDSGNPVLSSADTQAYQQAFKALDLLVVIDVALTETAQLAHYVLPAASQFEKMESTFFTFGFPTNYYHLRHAVVKPTGNVLPEPEIYRRLIVALGVLPDDIPALTAVAKLDRQYPKLKLYPAALAATLKLKPEWIPYVPVLLYATLGKALPKGSESAALIWGACQFYAQRNAQQVRRTGLTGKGVDLGNQLFERILTSKRAEPLSTFEYDECWRLMQTDDKKVRLAIPELLAEIRALKDEASPFDNSDYPFVLMAGERRSYNANQIFRVPDWRKKDRDGFLRIHPDDAAGLNVSNGMSVVVESARGKLTAQVQLDEGVQRQMITLPHGYGMAYPDKAGGAQWQQNGPRINDLTQSDHCDPITKTPYHKFVPVKVYVAAD